jgi:hypothetical protein
MARRREPIDESEGMPRPLPPPAFEYESYLRSDGSLDGRYVMLPNGYDPSTPDVERTDYRGAEPWAEDVWQSIGRCLGMPTGEDPVLRHEVRQAVFTYGANCAQAAREPDIRWSRVRGSLAKIDKAAQQLAACLIPQPNHDARESRERSALRELLVSSANRSKADAQDGTMADAIQHAIRVAAALLPAAEFDAPLSDGDGRRLLNRLDEVLARLPAIAADAQENAQERTEVARRGPKSGDELAYLVAHLATIYEACTGRTPDVVENPRHPAGYLGGFYTLVRTIAENLPKGFGPVCSKTASAIGKDLRRLLRGTSKGGRRATHVRRHDDGIYRVDLIGPASPALVRLLDTRSRVSNDSGGNSS